MDENTQAAVFMPRFVPRPKASGIPTAGVFDAPAVLISVNEQWRSHLLGVIEALDQPDTWSGSPEEIEAARQEVRKLALGLSVGGGDVGCCTEIRRNPTTGELEYSQDGGETWDQVTDPWNEGTGPYATPPGNLGGADDEVNRCLAAANATAVINEFYRQTAGEAGAALYNTVLSMNMFLNQLNNALLQIVYPNAGRLLVASGFLDFDWGTYATAPALESGALADLQCLLYCNATATDGIVSFDHGAIYDNLIATLGVNPGTAVTLLVGYMGEAGLNHAGGVVSNETAECDCPECATSGVYTWDFRGTSSELGWEGFNTGSGYQAGFGNAWGFYAFFGLGNWYGSGEYPVRIRSYYPIGNAATHFTRIEAQVNAYGSMVGEAFEPGGDILSGSLEWVGDDVDVTGAWQPTIGSNALGGGWGDMTIQQVRVYWEGESPV